MKKILVAIALSALGISAGAQTVDGNGLGEKSRMFDFKQNTKRLELGFIAGQAGSFTQYAEIGMGASALIAGAYIDFLKADPQHKYDRRVSDTLYDDTCAFCVNAGYQIPIFNWLRIMPIVGYAQTNEGVTDGSTIHLSAGDESATWYHDYKVTPGSRTHYFNYGGGLSIQPVKWFSINLIATTNALYGGISLDVLAFARQ